jgi:hypothetical protein
LNPRTLTLAAVVGLVLVTAPADAWGNPPPSPPAHCVVRPGNECDVPGDTTPTTPDTTVPAITVPDTTPAPTPSTTPAVPDTTPIVQASLPPETVCSATATKPPCGQPRVSLPRTGPGDVLVVILLGLAIVAIGLILVHRAEKRHARRRFAPGPEYRYEDDYRGDER